MNSHNRMLDGFLVFAALLFAGCGGSSGGDSPPPQADSPPDTGGITRTGIAFAEGPITGFGSIIVNGIAYDTSNATFIKDGQAVTESDFSVGEIVLVKGTIDDDDTNAVAETVEFDDSVEGPVTSVDTALRQITVLGQLVTIGASTSIDDSCPETLDGLLSVPAVEVSGFRDAAGVIDATRIECKAAAGEFEVTGTVSQHDPAAMTFMINALVVDYSNAMLADFPGGQVSDGDPVEAKGDSLGASDALLATRVQYKGNRFDEAEGDHAEIEGFITRFASAQDFDVAGIPVTTTTGGTVFEGGAEADLGLNLKIEVEGEFDAAGVLVATKIEIKSSTAIRVTGVVDSVTGNELVILGVTVNTDPLKTRFEDKTDLGVEPFGIGDLFAGDYVEARGQELPVGQITALLVERDDPRARTELRGFVEAGGVNRPNLTVLGVDVVTDAGTVLRDANGTIFPTVDDFWNAVGEGSRIDIDGTETGTTTLLAEEIQLEEE